MSEIRYALRTLIKAPGLTLVMVVTPGIAVGAATVIYAVMDLIRSMDSRMPTLGRRTMEDYYGSRIVNLSRLLVGTVGGLGAIGVLLAMMGLYGLVAYSVTRQTREIGIHMAVGAAPASVLRMVLKRGMILAGLGMVVGIVAIVATSGLLNGVFQGQLTAGDRALGRENRVDR